LYRKEQNFLKRHESSMCMMCDVRALPSCAVARVTCASGCVGACVGACAGIRCGTRTSRRASTATFVSPVR
jgi:hypothetical protein